VGLKLLNIVHLEELPQLILCGIQIHFQGATLFNKRLRSWPACSQRRNKWSCSAQTSIVEGEDSLSGLGIGLDMLSQSFAVTSKSAFIWYRQVLYRKACQVSCWILYGIKYFGWRQ